MRFNINNKKQNIINNTSKTIRIRKDTDAFRDGKFDFFHNKFEENYPELANYTLCQENLGSIFKYGRIYNSKTYGSSIKYPLYSAIGNISIFSSSICNNDSIVTPTPVTPITPTPITPTPEPPQEPPPECYAGTETVIELSSNYGNTIYGYAFYVDSLRSVDIPNIGPVQALCAGGHTCCRTEFTPTLLIGDNVITGNTVNLNNLDGCDQSLNPIPGFVDLTGYERSSAFEFSYIDPSLLSTSKFVLSCDLANCHNSVTMVVLVAYNTLIEAYEVIFNSCVPACVEIDMGTIRIPEGEPVPCEGSLNEGECTPPPEICDYIGKTTAIVTFTGLDVGAGFGSEEQREEANAIINGSHKLTFFNVDSGGISIDPNPMVIGTMFGTVYFNLFFSAINDGLGNLNLQIGLNIMQTASAYPWLYGINFMTTVSTDNVCAYNQIDGSVTTGGGITAPFATGDGSEQVFVNIF